MNISPTLLDALQEQFNVERQNEAVYKSLSAQLEAQTWPGTAVWMHKASEDESKHADMFKDYILERGATPAFEDLAAIEPVAPDLDICLRAALYLEEQTTRNIMALMALAQAENDPTTIYFLDWFAIEQMQSEHELTNMLMEWGRQDAAGHLLLDREYGQRQS